MPTPSRLRDGPMPVCNAGLGRQSIVTRRDETPARWLGEAKRSRARLRGTRRTHYQTEWVLAGIWPIVLWQLSGGKLR